MQLSGMASTALKKSAQKGVSCCLSAKLSWGLWWLLSLKAPCCHRGEDWVTWLYCEDLKSHITHIGFQVLHRDIRGWRCWETWWVKRLQAVPWCFSHLEYVCPGGPRRLWDLIFLTSNCFQLGVLRVGSLVQSRIVVFGLASEVLLGTVLC